jgi:hypothetical protein
VREKKNAHTRALSFKYICVFKRRLGHCSQIKMYQTIGKINPKPIIDE